MFQKAWCKTRSIVNCRDWSPFRTSFLGIPQEFFFLPERVKFDQPSSTARLIARSLLFLAQEKRFLELMPPGMLEGTSCFAADNPEARERLARRLRTPVVRLFVKAVEALVLPGIQIHYLLRKLALEALIRDSLANATRQVVVLGAGLDTLAGRLHHEFPDARFLEVDHPATQRAKIELMHDWLAPGPNLYFLYGDLAEQTLDKLLLESPHFEPESPTLFLAEGLLMYLPVEQIDSILAFVSSHHPANRIAFTYMENQPPAGKPGFEGFRWFTNAWLRWKNEPFTWGLSRNEVESFVRQRDLQLLEHLNATYLRERFLSENETLRNLKPISGESIAFCQTA